MEPGVELDGSMTLSAADAVMVKRGLWLPVDGAGGKPVGELLTEDSAGPLVEGFGGWEPRVDRIELEGVRGARELLEGADAKLAVGSRGALGRVIRLWLTGLRRPGGSIVVRTREGAALGTAQPHWRVWSQGRVTAGFLGAEDVEIGLTLPKGAIAMRMALMEDEALRERLWKWPEDGGGIGERVRVWLPSGIVRSVMMEARVMAWVSDGPGQRVLARVVTREIGRLESVAESAGGWVERVDRAMDEAAARKRYGEKADRFEELRRLIAR